MKKKIIYGIGIVLLFHLLTAGGCKKDDVPAPPTPDTGTVTDVEGNIYNTKKIGTQTWMVENLKTTKYRNGESISLVTGEIGWSNLIIPKSPAYTYSEFNAANAAVYGLLYNWHAVSDSRNIAPSGWHVPSDVEWATLIDYLGGKNTATANKMMATNTWKTPNNANNSSGFTALAGGAISFEGRFTSTQNIGSFTTWWSATAANDPVNHFAYLRRIFNDGIITATATFPNYGFSVRCVKD